MTKGLSLWHESARLDEYRTLRSYGIGAGAAIQALATEHDVEAALREEREAEEMARAEAERYFGWKANYGCCETKAEGERRRRKAMRKARQQAQREAEAAAEARAARDQAHADHERRAAEAAAKRAAKARAEAEARAIVSNARFD